MDLLIKSVSTLRIAAAITDAASGIGGAGLIGYNTSTNSRVMFFNAYNNFYSSDNARMNPIISQDWAVGGQTTNAIAYITTGSIGSAVCCNWQDQIVRVVDLATGTVTPLTVDYCYQTTKSNQAAFISNGANSATYFCAYTVGKIGQIVASPLAGNLISVSAMAGANANTMIPSSTVGHIMLGTTGGDILEITGNGTLVKSLHIGATPQNMSMSGSKLFVSTNNLIYQIDWSGPSISAKYTYLSSIGAIFSPIINNLMLRADEGNQSIINLINTALTPAIGIQDITGSSCTNLGLSNQGVGWTASGNYLNLFQLTPYTSTGVNTRAQNPPGTDAAQRVMRIPIPQGIGRGQIELDTSAPAGTLSLTSNLTGCPYYELSLVGSASLNNEKADLRRFTV